MSRENVEIVRNLYATHDRAQAEFWDLLPPDIVFDFSRLIANPRIMDREAARAEYDSGRHEIFKEGRFRWDPEELIDAGDSVLAHTRASGRGKDGHSEISVHTWGVWAFRDGSPIKWTYLGEHRGEALEAVGLSE